MWSIRKLNSKLCFPYMFHIIFVVFNYMSIFKTYAFHIWKYNIICRFPACKVYIICREIVPSLYVLYKFVICHLIKMTETSIKNIYEYVSLHTSFLYVTGYNVIINYTFFVFLYKNSYMLAYETYNSSI